MNLSVGIPEGEIRGIHAYTYTGGFLFGFDKI